MDDTDKIEKAIERCEKIPKHLSKISNVFDFDYREINKRISETDSIKDILHLIQKTTDNLEEMLFGDHTDTTLLEQVIEILNQEAETIVYAQNSNTCVLVL